MNSFQKGKKLPDLNTVYSDNSMKQNNIVDHLGCCFDHSGLTVPISPFMFDPTLFDILHF